MQTVIPVSYCTRTANLTLHAHIFLSSSCCPWLLVAVFSPSDVMKEIFGAEITKGFNMAVFGSTRSTWNGVNMMLSCTVHARLQEAKCERVKWLVFVSLKQSFFFCFF